MEAVHRTIKDRCLKNCKFESIEALQKYLDWAVYDYNKIRPITNTTRTYRLYKYLAACRTFPH
ncbi:MAG: integrase core domain-containing protein [Bacteroidia bacterium]